jgi:hypothetical protein
MQAVDGLVVPYHSRAGGDLRCGFGVDDEEDKAVAVVCIFFSPRRAG